MTRLLPLAALLTASLLWPAAHAQDLLSVTSNKLGDGGFEGDQPAYWSPMGEGATWSTARAHSGTHALALSGPGAASWTQDEVVRNWVDAFPANTALTLGAWVWAEGVNTAPAAEAEKFQLLFSFRDENGADLLGGPVVVDLPQEAASTGGWVQVSTAALGEITLPSPATSVTAVVRKGADATGTVYVDDFYAAGAGWHGANVDLPGGPEAGWYTYWPGFDAGGAAPNWVVAKTTEEAHTGAASLRVERLGEVLPGEEAVAISERVPVAPGEPVLISYWLKTAGNASPETIGEGDNNVGLTALWYSSLASGAAGYNELGGLDIRLNGEYNPEVIPLLPRQAENGWTQYAFVVYPREGAEGMELRLRYWHTFTGATYWDDVALTNIGGAALAVANEPGSESAEGRRSTAWLLPNAPNPFRGATAVRFTLPQATDVTLEVYDLLGRRVALLLDDARLAADTHEVRFDAQGLPSGAYLVLLRTPQHTEACMVTALR